MVTAQAIVPERGSISLLVVGYSSAPFLFSKDKWGWTPIRVPTGMEGRHPEPRVMQGGREPDQVSAS